MKLLDTFNGFLAEVERQAKAYYGERLVTLAVFGSVGRGTPRPDSDVDLLLVIDGLPPGRLPRIREFDRVEQALTPYLQQLRRQGIDTCLSPVIKSPEEVLRGSLLFLDMIEDARLLYDREGFFARFLERFRKRLEKLGARRVKSGGAWHWVLKDDYRVGEVFEI